MYTSLIYTQICHIILYTHAPVYMHMIARITCRKAFASKAPAQTTRGIAYSVPSWVKAYPHVYPLTEPIVSAVPTALL